MTSQRAKQAIGEFGESVIAGVRPGGVRGCVDKIVGTKAVEIKTALLQQFGKTGRYGRFCITVKNHNALREYCDKHSYVPVYIFVICLKVGSEYKVLKIKEGSWDFVDNYRPSVSRKCFNKIAPPQFKIPLWAVASLLDDFVQEQEWSR